MPQRWNNRYSVFLELPAVSYGLKKYAHLLPCEGTGLDLACGLGQNTIFLTKHGLTMESWDYSAVGLERMLHHCSVQKVKVNQRCIDLVNNPWPKQEFDLICVTAFLDRRLCPQIVLHLKPGGILVYQTFNQVIDIAGERVSKPRRSELLLDRGELLVLFEGLEPLVYRDDQEMAPKGHALAGKALLIARKPRLEKD